MFKKSKNSKLAPPPTAPSFDEILSDIETFQIELNPTTSSSVGSTPGGLEAWWDVFEEFVSNLKSLSIINSEINGYKLKLESCKLELETESALLRNNIEEQQEVAKVVDTKDAVVVDSS